MLDRTGSGAIRRDRVDSPAGGRQSRRRHRPQLECLEGRSLLAAALAPIADVSVPTNLGIQVPLDGSASGSPNQVFAVASSNPNIKAAVARGKFLTLTITHTKATDRPDDVLIQNSPITYQLFDDLTPLTASRIESFVQSGFYTGKEFHRVAPGFPGPNDFIVQGGSKSGDGSGASGEPGTPFVDEFVQQLAFTGSDQVAMANSGPDTNDTQFFFTTASPTFLNFKHTIFGQVVSGDETIDRMTEVVMSPNNPTEPLSPILINSATLSDTNPNGVLHIDATQADPGETAVITVTAADPSTGTTTRRSFTVRVNADVQNERAFIQQLPYPTQIVTTPPGTTSQPAVVYVQNVAVNQVDIFQIPGVDPEGDRLTYTVKGGVTVNPTSGAKTFTEIPTDEATATVDQNTGIVTVTPAQGHTGPINLLVGVRDQTNRAAQNNPAAGADDPDNFSYHQIILNVAGTTPVALTPIALPVQQTVAANTPATVQLLGVTANPATSTGLTYTLTSQPTSGTISQFDQSTGTFVYTARPNFEGTDTFQYTVTDSGTGTTNLTSPPATVTLTVTQAATGSVRQIGNVLVVTPNPRRDGGTNTIVVRQIDSSDPAQNKLQVEINGVIDVTQPLVSAIDRIVVYGAKAKDRITIEPGVDDAIRVTLDGGHGGRNNVLKAGNGPTREHGWFGFNIMEGGGGPNQLIGRKGRVQFLPTIGTEVMFAGQGHPPRRHGHTTPPSGTFFKVNRRGRIVPIPTPRQPHPGAIARALARQNAAARLAASNMALDDGTDAAQ